MVVPLSIAVVHVHVMFLSERLVLFQIGGCWRLYVGPR